MSSPLSSRLVVGHKSANHCKEFSRDVEGHDATSHLTNLLPHLDSIKSEINEYLSVLVEEEKESKKSVPEKETAASVASSKPLDSCYVDDSVTQAKRLKGGK